MAKRVQAPGAPRGAGMQRASPPSLTRGAAAHRDTPANAPGLKDLSLDLSLWQPLIEDRAFVPWLVKHPSEQARLLSPGTQGAG